MPDPIHALPKALAQLRQRAEAAFHASGPGAALAALDHGWSDGLRHRDLALLAAKLARRAARPDDVLSWLQRARDLSPDEAAIWMGIGQCLLERGAAEDAAAHVLRALRLAPASADIRLIAAIALRAAGDTAGQADQASHALRLSGGTMTTARLILAQAHMAQGDFAAAEADIAPLATSAQEPVALAILRAELAMAKGQWAEALLLLAQQAESTPAALSEIAASFDACLTLFVQRDTAAAQNFFTAQGFGDPSQPVAERAAGPVLVRSWQGDPITPPCPDSSAVTDNPQDAAFVLWLAPDTRLAPGAIDALRDALVEEPSACAAVPLLWGGTGAQGVTDRLSLEETARQLTTGDLALGRIPLAAPVALLVARGETGLPAAPPSPADLLHAALNGRAAVVSPSALAAAPRQAAIDPPFPALLARFGAMNLLCALHLAKQNIARHCAQRRLDRPDAFAPQETPAPLFVSHAQNFEDIILHRALRDISRGLYIDIGASHPRDGSVSLAFHRMGWRGVHVEPLPKVAARLRRDRPGDTVLDVAVSSQTGPITLFEVGEGIGLSTLDADLAETHREAGWQVGTCTVATMTLETLLDRHGAKGDVHWLKIDVEGAEADVLASWGTSPIRPWIVAVEATRPGSPELMHQDWEPLLLEKGYDMVMFDGLNRYYLAPGQDHRRAFFAAPPNIFDGFTTTRAHWAQRPAPAAQGTGGPAPEAVCRIDQLRDRLLAAAGLA